MWGNVGAGRVFAGSLYVSRVLKRGVREGGLLIAHFSSLVYAAFIDAWKYFEAYEENEVPYFEGTL